MSPSLARADLLPQEWSSGTFEQTCSLHGIAPYIGRLKSTIAGHLVANFSRPGDVVADPFCGSGTIALEAALQNRRVLAADCNEYALLLTRAKLSATDEASTVSALHDATECAKVMSVDLRTIPAWVRRFFHPRTLRESFALAQVLKQRNEHMLLACLLGILHHQRPGFLSYPSSHLVPYLRERSFPRDEFVEMYEYRDVTSRMLKKIARTYKRVPCGLSARDARIRAANPRRVTLPGAVDAIITSPPYMNALDYVVTTGCVCGSFQGRGNFRIQTSRCDRGVVSGSSCARSSRKPNEPFATMAIASS